MTQADDVWMLYSTFGGREEALCAARALLEKRLVACATVHDGAVSLYRWEGKLCEEAEVILTAKTTHKALKPAMAALKELHPYELPCIVAHPLAESFAPFAAWVKEEVL